MTHLYRNVGAFINHTTIIDVFIKYLSLTLGEGLAPMVMDRLFQVLDSNSNGYRQTHMDVIVFVDAMMMHMIVRLKQTSFYPPCMLFGMVHANIKCDVSQCSYFLYDTDGI